MTPNFPARAKEVLKAEPFQHLIVGFSVKTTAGTGTSFSPQQAFVRFTPRHASGRAVTLTAAPAKGTKGKFSLSLTPESAAAQFGRASGEYDVSIVVGDALLAAPLDYAAGSVQLRFNQVQQICPQKNETSFLKRLVI